MGKKKFSERYLDDFFREDKKRYLVADKEEWAEEECHEGEWTNEPDYLTFFENGLPCQIMRNKSIGSLLGYVFISDEHHLFNEKELIENECEVHGGITFIEYGDFGGRVRLKIGFDCGHFMDIFPRFIKSGMYDGTDISGMYDGTDIIRPTYKNIEYVKREVKSLARQLNSIKLADE